MYQCQLFGLVRGAEGADPSFGFFFSWVLGGFFFYFGFFMLGLCYSDLCLHVLVRDGNAILCVLLCGVVLLYQFEILTQRGINHEFHLLERVTDLQETGVGTPPIGSTRRGETQDCGVFEQGHSHYYTLHTLLHCTILLDSQNMVDAPNRETARDRVSCCPPQAAALTLCEGKGSGSGGKGSGKPQKWYCGVLRHGWASVYGSWVVWFAPLIGLVGLRALLLVLFVPRRGLVVSCLVVWTRTKVDTLQLCRYKTSVDEWRVIWWWLKVTNCCVQEGWLSCSKALWI